jgi:hypothetical protein
MAPPSPPASTATAHHWLHPASWLKVIPPVAALSVAGPAVLLVAAYVAWHSWGAGRLDRAMYSLELEQLQVTPQPAWITADVRQEVFQGARLDRVSSLDPQAAATVAHAFRMHPWVRRTLRVTRLAGGRVQVDLEYRRPLALVHQPSVGPGGDAPGRGADTQGSDVAGAGGTAPRAAALGLAVDHDGVVLPSQDFQGLDANPYFWVYAYGAQPVGLYVGSQFGDARVLDALDLCRLLEPHRQTLQLRAVYVYPDPRSSLRDRWLLELETHLGGKIVWGSPPGRELPSEMNVEQKLAELLSGTADGVGGPLQRRDLSSPVSRGASR